jgi:hypothetical protein
MFGNGNHKPEVSDNQPLKSLLIALLDLAYYFRFFLGRNEIMPLKVPKIELFTVVHRNRPSPLSELIVFFL